MKMEKVLYSELSAKAQESYNFHKLSAILADYGFSSNWLNVDFESADFIATHFNGIDIIKVQLKGRLTIDKKYIGKEIHIAFPYENQFYMIPHDHLIEVIQNATQWLNSKSWTENGAYSTGNPSKELLSIIEDFKL